MSAKAKERAAELRRLGAEMKHLIEGLQSKYRVVMMCNPESYGLEIFDARAPEYGDHDCAASVEIESGEVTFAVQPLAPPLSPVE